jgi:hypothetical protein
MLALLMAMAAPAPPAYEPPPELWYRHAVSCAVTLKLAAGKDPSSEDFADLMTWGLIMADRGRKAGRTRDQVDHEDLEAAEPFFRYLKEKKPAAFAAHRAYCHTLFDADRP